MPDLTVDVIKIFSLGTIGFALAFLFTPILTNFLYKHKLWKKIAREKAIDKKDLAIFKQFHSEGETNVPRFGGLLIWVTVLFLIFFFFLISKITNIGWLDKLNFLSRSQTWLPLFALISSAILGLVDDTLQVSGKGKYIGGGLSLKKRLGLVFLIGLIGGLWFYYKLDWRTIHVPGLGDLHIGIWYIPFFYYSDDGNLFRWGD